MYPLLQHLLLFLQIFTVLCASPVTSFPLGVSRLSWQCWPENIELLVDLACSRNGSSYIAAKYHPSSEDAVPLNREMEFSPWAYRPVCTDTVGIVGSELCVYTSTKFASGRGISFVTTPQLAEEMALLLPVRDETALDGILHSNLFQITQRTKFRGRCGLARHDFEAGDEVGSKVPILLMHDAMLELSWPEHEELLRVAVLQLPFMTQRLLGLLSSNTDRPDLVLSGIVSNHAGFPIKVKNHKHYGLFPEMAFFNHDCAPNSKVRIDPSTLAMTVQAARNIPEGDEITISYFTEDRGVHFKLYANRQQSIEDQLQFRCSCSRCRRGPFADTALQQLIDLEQALKNWDYTVPMTPDDALELIWLYKHEGLEAFLDEPYGLAALAFNTIGEARKASTYASLAASVLLSNGLNNGSNYCEWVELASNPMHHWSWRPMEGP